MKQIQELYSRTSRPVKVLQFGEGNFLRAFADWMIDVANEKHYFNGSIAIVKPIPFGTLNAFLEQDNLYTVSLRGKQHGQVIAENHVVKSIDRVLDCATQYEDFLALAHLDSLEIVLSNTTEAGIVFDEQDHFDQTPPITYPGKLTRFLFERFDAFSGDTNKGLILLPVELIEENGKKLKDCVFRLAKLWNLGDAFLNWMETACIFCSTLVDRIVTGYPKDEVTPYYEELGYTDQLLDIAEPFGLWVIESSRDISARFPLDKAGMPVLFTTDQTPYRERKVRILNGAHTSTVLAAFLTGKNTVLECMEDPLLRRFMTQTVLEEIVPTVPLPRAEAEEFADSVFERFENPFVKHALLSISLNSISKWRSRILPSLRDQLQQNDRLPPLLTFSFAALLEFYTKQDRTDHALLGKRGEETYEIHDSAEVLDFFADKSALPTEEYVVAIASNLSFWGEDLTTYPQFTETVCQSLSAIRNNGMRTAMEQLLNGTT